MPKRKVEIQHLLYYENQTTAHTKCPPIELKRKRLRSIKKSSEKLRTSNFQQKLEDVDGDECKSRRNSFVRIKAKENSFLKHEDLSKSDVNNCDGINFISEDDECEANVQPRSTMRNQPLNWEEYYLKWIKNSDLQESIKVICKAKEDLNSRRLDKELESHETDHSIQQTPKKFKRVEKSTLSDSINYLSDSEGKVEVSSLSLVENAGEIEKKNYGHGSIKIQKSKNSRYFNAGSTTQILSSKKKNNAIDKLRINRKSGASKFTPKVTDAIKFITESDCELDDVNDLAFEKSAFKNINYKVKLINSKNNPKGHTFNSAKITDAIRFISDSENEGEPYFDIVNKEDFKKDSEYYFSFANQSLKTIEVEPKLVKILDKINFISELDDETENNALDQNSSNVNLSPKKPQQTNKFVDKISSSNKNKKNDYRNIDTPEKEDRNKNSRHFLTVTNGSSQNTACKLKLFQLSEEFKFIPEWETEIKNSSFGQDSSKGSLSSKKALQPSKDVDGINYITDTEIEEDKSSMCRSSFDDKLKLDYIWNYQLSSFNLDFDKMKLSQSNAREQFQLKENSNKTDREKEFLKIVGKKKLPSFFLGSVCESNLVDRFSGRMDFHDDQ